MQRAGLLRTFTQVECIDENRAELAAVRKVRALTRRETQEPDRCLVGVPKSSGRRSPLSRSLAGSSTCQPVDTVCSLTRFRRCQLLQPGSEPKKRPINKQSSFSSHTCCCSCCCSFQSRRPMQLGRRDQVVVFLLSACPAGPSVCPPNPPHTTSAGSFVFLEVGRDRSRGCGERGSAGTKGVSWPCLSTKAEREEADGEPSTRWSSP